MDFEQKAAPEQAVGEERARELMRILQKYKAGKAQTEHRIVDAEQWWKLRNADAERSKSASVATAHYKSKSAWLHNVVASKHADAIEAYPEPNILPREEGDKEEASRLSSIIPCILDQVGFEEVYSDAMWQKCKTGTGAYKVVWDAAKLNGFGDIAIKNVNLLNLYWEPGVTDIQDSRYFFSTELVDKDLLQERFPEAADRLDGQTFLSTKFLYDDNVSTEDKLTLVECYYHKVINGKSTLQYLQFCNDVVLYATENEPEMAQRGLYDHGLFPFVFDPLFPIEGSPCGYGYTDLCMGPQTTIDMINTAIVKNAMAGATPRFFLRQDGGVNEGEFLDLTKSTVRVQGSLAEDAIREIPHASLDGVYVNFLERTVQELRETSGNTESANGSAPSGVTAASAIAALQEASGKGSRDASLASYRAFTRIVTLVIELIRQFYDMPRQFRIVGEYGAEQFVQYTNAGIQPQPQGSAFGVDLGYRKPEFDIKVSAQKKSVYTKVSQNELAIQFFQLGFFNPQFTDQALMCLDMMDFDGKDMVAQKVAQNGSMAQKLAQYMQMCAMLAAQTGNQALMRQISADAAMTLGGADANAAAQMVSLPQSQEAAGRNGGQTRVDNARAKSLQSSQPDGGAVTSAARG